MIDLLDGTLKNLLESRLPAPGASVGFDAPDADWRGVVSGSDTRWLNVYLIEFRENRRLRSNELREVWQNGQHLETLAPVRLDCHYLVSAWSRAGVSGTKSSLVEATIDESVLLYDAAQILLQSIPLDLEALNPGVTLPPPLIEQPLPMGVAPPEGFAKLADFWMRMDWHWKPVIELIVTMPVVQLSNLGGPPVTTMFGDFHQTGIAEGEERLVIGGVIRTGNPAQPVPGAWVRLIEVQLTAATDPAGRFVFSGLERGTYHVQAGARGLPVQPVVKLDVPSLSGNYDLTLS